MEWKAHNCSDCGKTATCIYKSMVSSCRIYDFSGCKHKLCLNLRHYGSVFQKKLLLALKVDCFILAASSGPLGSVGKFGSNVCGFKSISNQGVCNMRKCITKVLWRLCWQQVFCFAIHGRADCPAGGKNPVQDAPAQTTERTTLINVQVDGTDSIGARLSTRLRKDLTRAVFSA